MPEFAGLSKKKTGSKVYYREDSLSNVLSLDTDSVRSYEWSLVESGDQLLKFTGFASGGHPVKSVTLVVTGNVEALSRSLGGTNSSIFPGTMLSAVIEQLVDQNVAAVNSGRTNDALGFYTLEVK